MIAIGDTIACPYFILRKYLDLAAIDLSSEHFSFKPTFRSGNKCSLIYENKPLGYTRARECILSKLRRISPNLILGLHSLRAGGASAAANAGIWGKCLKRHGR